jgi:hypothetical protein
MTFYLNTYSTFKFVKCVIKDLSGYVQYTLVVSIPPPGTFFGCFRSVGATAQPPENVSIDPHRPLAGLKNNSGQSGEIILFPNPNNGEFRILFPNDFLGKKDFTLFDAVGKKVDIYPVHEISNPAQNSLTIKAPAKLNSGIYFLRINEPGHIAVKRIVVE